MTVRLTPAQKRNLYKKANSGYYYVRLSNWNPKSGQHIVVFPTNKALNEGKLRFFRNFYPVLGKNDPPPKNKRGGGAYKQGRFLVINKSVEDLLLNNR